MTHEASMGLAEAPGCSPTGAQSRSTMPSGSICPAIAMQRKANGSPSASRRLSSRCQSAMAWSRRYSRSASGQVRWISRPAVPHLPQRSTNLNQVMHLSSCRRAQPYRTDHARARFQAGLPLQPRGGVAVDRRDRCEPDVMSEAFEAIAAPPEHIQFTYALFDEASGREFQSEPILNTAGLGTANGERPFRYFARPITFAPLSVIRMDVTEISTVRGELHVSLHGYKVLGAAGTPTGRRGPARRRRR